MGSYPLLGEMRILFDKGKQVGADPITHYVYLWRHGKIDRYVGKGGVNGRWAAHRRTIVDDPNDRNERKTHYFRAHLPEMTCYIIAEALKTDEANERETVEIRCRGYAANGTGTLLNAARGATINPRAERRPSKPSREHRAQKRLKAENEYAEARARGLSQAEIASACMGMNVKQLRGKIARALCLMGPGRYTRAQVMRKADVGKLFKPDAEYIRRAFFLRADLVGLVVELEPDGESLVVREATAAEKRDAIICSAYLTDRPTAAIARISGFAGEVPEPDRAGPPPLTRFQSPL